MFLDHRLSWKGPDGITSVRPSVSPSIQIFSELVHSFYSGILHSAISGPSELKSDEARFFRKILILGEMTIFWPQNGRFGQ